MANEIVITHNELIERGYKRKSWADKQLPSDKLYSVKFIEFKKEIRDQSKVTICYAYRPTVTGAPKLFETTCELSIGSEYILLQVHTANELDELTKIIEK